MRLARLICALPFVIAIGCGGDDDNAGDDDVALTPDAGPPDGPPPPPPPDANSCVGAPAPDICDDECVDFDTDEANCGGCGDACNGGEYCSTGDCSCPGTIVPAAPALADTQVQNIMGFIDVGGGTYPDPTDESIADGLVITKSPSNTEAGMTYDISSSIFAPPSVIAVYDGNLAAQSYESAFIATAGTITFDTICPGYFAGHADGVTFTGMTGGLMNPMPDPNGCTFTVERVDFAIGTTAECPPTE